MVVALWVRVDAAGIATMMLSTVNLPLMTKVRHAIRCYTQVPGYKFETYAKISFIKKYGITMYIPANNASVKPARILRTLAFKYPVLRCKLRIVHKSTFTDDPPNHPPGKRSRIGDVIVLLDGPDLNDRLKDLSEDFKFYVNDGFSVTLRGGARGDDTGIHLASQFRQSVVVGSAAEAVRVAAASRP